MTFSMICSFFWGRKRVESMRAFIYLVVWGVDRQMADGSTDGSELELEFGRHSAGGSPRCLGVGGWVYL